MPFLRKEGNGAINPLDSEYPLGEKYGQVPNQMSLSNMGRVMDPDEQDIHEITETGVAVVDSEDEAQLKEYIKEALSIENLVETFNDNSHQALLKLLALQDNAHPLKRGGIGLAYRTDALIMHCKNDFTAEENVVFDAILGMISSYPQNKSYRIEPDSFQQYAKYANSNTIYDVFRKGTRKLKDRNLVFENLGQNRDETLEIPWFNALVYKTKSKEERPHITFTPSDFFKDMAICSGLVHGAYGRLEVTTQLRGKYSISLYWFLENKKNYKETPVSKPGVFTMTFEEIALQFSTPEKYTKTDLEKRVLKPARESINQIEECDFTFDFEPKKVGNRQIGYVFTISKKNYIEANIRELPGDETLTKDEQQIGSILEASGITFTDKEVKKVASCLKRNKKDVMQLMQILISFKARLENTELDPIDDYLSYICKMIQEGVGESKKENRKDTVKEKYARYLDLLEKDTTVNNDGLTEEEEQEYKELTEFFRTHPKPKGKH